MPITSEIERFVTANGLDIYLEQVGQGPDVLLIGGAGDTVESWQSSSMGWPTAID